MLNIKNLNVVKEKIIPLALAGSLALSLSACGGKVEMSSIDFDDLMAIESVQDATIIDEMVGEGNLQYNDDMNILEAADQLYRFMDIVEVTDRVDYTGVDSLEPLSNDTYASTLSLNREEVEALVELSKYKGEDVVALEAKLTALKKLNYLNSYCKEWVNANGNMICEDIMIAAVKGSIADELELDGFAGINIPPRRTTVSDGPEDYFITVDDESYRVPMGEGEIWNTINYVYELQGSDLGTVDQEQRYETYRKAINYAKTTIAAGSNVKNNKIVTQYDAGYIEGNFLK